MCSPPTTTSRNFTFTVDPMLACGATVTASLQMQDGATNYGTITYPFVTGTSAVAIAQNFDGVAAPALPAGWTTSATGIGVPWVTSIDHSQQRTERRLRPRSKQHRRQHVAFTDLRGPGWRSDPDVQEQLQYRVDV